MLRTIFHVAEHARADAPPEIKESTLLSPTPSLSDSLSSSRDNPFDAAIRHPAVVSLGREKKRRIDFFLLFD